jgi:hypothetical protein
LVGQFLAAHPNVRLHFTPTYSSWLNQIEIWFSKLQRQVIDRGILPPSRTCAAKPSAPSACTPTPPNPSAGNTPIPDAEFNPGKYVSQAAH